MAYIEFWGVMQATFIQQDAIKELYKTITDMELKTGSFLAWNKIRHLRNTCAGHPVNKSKPKNKPMSRDFMSRSFGDYKNITYELWQQEAGRSHPTFPLGHGLDEYACEASNTLKAILKIMQTKWP